MKTTTAATDSPEALELCKVINDRSKPVMVPVSPRSNTSISQCFYNVRDAVREIGGKQVFGWVIWEWIGVYVEAEHHSVWLTPSGELVDVTPQANGEREVLFLKDESAEFYFPRPKWRDNIRRPSQMDPDIIEFLNASSAKSRFELRHSQKNGRERQVTLNPSLVERHDSLIKRLEDATERMRKFL